MKRILAILAVLLLFPCLVISAVAAESSDEVSVPEESSSPGGTWTGETKDININFVLAEEPSAEEWDKAIKESVLTEVFNYGKLVEDITVTVITFDENFKKINEIEAGGSTSLTVSVPDITYHIQVQFKCEKADVENDISVETLYVHVANYDLDGKAIDIEMHWTQIALKFYNAALEKDTDAIIDELIILGGVDNGDMVDSLINTLRELVSRWSIGGSITNADKNFGSATVDEYIQKFYEKVYPIAFAIMALLWLFNVAKSSVSLELYNKDFVKPLLRLLWGIGMMMFCMPLLEFIYGIFNELTSSISSSFGGVVSLFDAIASESDAWKDDSWVVGGIITFINIIRNLPKIAVYILLEIVFGLVFYVILFLRFVKLAVMQCISPFFAACSVGDKTEKYYHSFLREYIIHAGQLLMTYLMYIMVTICYASLPSGWNPLGNAVGIIVYIAGIIGLIGSGKFLRQLMT